MNYPVLVYCAGLWAAFREFHNNWSVMISLHPVGYPVTPHGHDDRRRICILTSRRNSSREYLGLTHFYSIMAHNLFLSSHIRLFIHYVTYAVNYYYYYYTICMSPVTDISSRYFSWTSGDPHRSRFKLHIAVLSIFHLYTNSCILTSFPLPFAQHFCLWVLPHLSVCMFSIIINCN